MTRFKLSGLVSIGLGVIYLAQLARSFPLIRIGCVLLLLAVVVALGIDDGSLARGSMALKPHPALSVLIHRKERGT